MALCLSPCRHSSEKQNTPLTGRCSGRDSTPRAPVGMRFTEASIPAAALVPEQVGMCGPGHGRGLARTHFFYFSLVPAFLDIWLSVATWPRAPTVGTLPQSITMLAEQTSTGASGAGPVLRG